VKRIVIFGAGDQGTIVADILQSSGIVPVAFADDTPSLHGTSVLGIPVIGASVNAIEHDAVIVAIGDNYARRMVTERMLAAGETLATAIHPFASIAPSATIGEGSMISAGALVLPRVILGRGVLLNTKASIDHDSVAGDFTHISAGATVGAKVRIGEETLVALGSSIASRCSVGARSVIGAGAVVVRDIPDDVTALGVPARITSDRRSETRNR
jgi:sugar O-acyltransferase (sialic acid O-acetyltransferase NeuD family)